MTERANLRPRGERCPDSNCTDESQCWRCDYEESQAKPQPLEIPLEAARTMHDVLGNLLAEHEPAADLREQYAAAIEADLEQFFRDHPEEPRNSPWVCGMRDAAAAVRAADAVLAVRDRELEQLRAAIARAHHVADLIAAGAPWTASRADTARRIREALDPQEES